VRRVIPPDTPMFIGQNLRMIREQRGLTVVQVAKKMKVDKSTVTRLENQYIGKSRIGTLIKYLSAVGAVLIPVPVSYPTNVSPAYEAEKVGEGYIYQVSRGNFMPDGV
jgi:transcriptional regulator with XRE-family HTH domain